MDGRFQALIAPIADDTQSHRGTAFIIESLLLLIFVTASIAIVVQLLGGGYAQGIKADKLSTAVSIASNEAERFTADPAIKSREILYIETDSGVEKVASKKSLSDEDFEYNGERISSEDPNVFILKRKISTDTLTSGKVYNASIAVNCQGEEVYSLDTAKYVSDSPADTGDDAGTGEEGGV